MLDNTQKKCFTQTHGSLSIDLPLRGPNFVSLTFTVPPQSSLWVFSDGQNTRKSVRHFSFAVVVCSALLLVFVHSTHSQSQWAAILKTFDAAVLVRAQRNTNEMGKNFSKKKNFFFLLGFCRFYALARVSLRLWRSVRFDCGTTLRSVESLVDLGIGFLTWTN